MSEIIFKANPIQKAFIESTHEADLFSSRMGEGKSAGLCWAAFYFTKQNPGANLIIIRDTWVNLEATTQQEFFEWFGAFGVYKASTKVFTWKVAGFNNGTLRFMGLDDPSDASSLQSLAIAGFLMDEPAPAAESGGISEDIFDVALARRRQKGMKYYIAKLAQNNPDENHWTYRRFVDPGTIPTPQDKLLPEQASGFTLWHTDQAENLKNLPPGYYESLRNQWSHRPDFVQRFVEGQFGYISKGQKVTPEWSDNVHLTTGLAPIKGSQLWLLWDFGLNPTCVITQVTPMRHWNMIESFVGDGIGVEELITMHVKPTLESTYKGFIWGHVGDPMGKMREQSSSKRSAVKVIKKELGGKWFDGPVRIEERISPLKAALRQLVGGKGMIQVDRDKCKEVYLALRGGWHYHIARSGLVSENPQKDEHSHPGDAVSYGAAKLFPLGKLQKRAYGTRQGKRASFFKGNKTKTGLGFEKPGAIPKEAMTR